MNAKCVHCQSENTEFQYVTVNPYWHLEGCEVWRCLDCGQEFTANAVETLYEDVVYPPTQQGMF